MGIVSLLIQIVAGALGGTGAGKMLKGGNLSQVLQLVVGAVGGLGGGQIADQFITSASGGDLASIITSIVSGGVGGGVLTGIVGAIMGAKAK